MSWLKLTNFDSGAPQLQGQNGSLCAVLDWALVQAGYRNRFGHPVAEVMARYPSVGAQVVDSPHCGAMHWHTARPDVVQCERQDAARYWHHQSLP